MTCAHTRLHMKERKPGRGRDEAERERVTQTDEDKPERVEKPEWVEATSRPPPATTARARASHGFAASHLHEGMPNSLCEGSHSSGCLGGPNPFLSWYTSACPIRDWYGTSHFEDCMNTLSHSKNHDWYMLRDHVASISC